MFFFGKKCEKRNWHVTISLITYHQLLSLKKVSKDLRKSLLSLIRGARGVRWRSPRTPNCYDAQRCHWNFGTQTWQKNLRKMSVPVDTSFGKKHRLGRSELGFSPANSANKFSSSEVQIAMLASLPRCWELHAITSYKNCTTHRVNQSNLGKSRVCTDCYTVNTAKIYFRNCFFFLFLFLFNSDWSQNSKNWLPCKGM